MWCGCSKLRSAELVRVAQPIAVWGLKVNADQTATLTCGDGNGREVDAKRIEFTNFPEPGIRFYYADWVIHLPSEY